MLKLRGGGGPFTIIDIAYPGFDGRSKAVNWPAFLESVLREISGNTQAGTCAIYGTGIGALLALCVRVEGCALDVPILMQGPVLWGLEHRLMPRLMRYSSINCFLPRLFASPPFQRHFTKRYFVHEPSRKEQMAFFDGYDKCAALPDLFRWLNPSLLRNLETQLIKHPDRLANISIWLGDRDKVVGRDEIRSTEAALNVSWPLRSIPNWGHYPMIDTPEEWVIEVDSFFENLERDRNSSS